MLILSLESGDKPPAHKWTDRDPALSEVPYSPVGRAVQLVASWPLLCSPSLRAVRTLLCPSSATRGHLRVFGKVISSEGTSPRRTMGMAHVTSE